MKTNITIFFGIVFLFLFPFMGKAANEPHWVCDVYAYELDMTLYASVNINGQSANSENIEIAAFCGDECRGVAELMSVAGMNSAYYYLRIRSNNLTDRITFKGYDKGSKKEIAFADALDFSNQKQYGYPSSPFVLNSFINPEDVGNVTNTTETLHLSGEWSTSELQSLSQNIHEKAGSITTNSSLTTVDLTEVSFEAGSSLNGVFTDCEALTSVTLNDIPSGDNADAFSGSNPNCLIFVPVDEVNIPQAWANVVKGAQADNIILTDQRLFSAPRNFQAAHIEYARTFQKVTDETWNSGWEAICVPFKVQSVEKKDVIVRNKPVKRSKSNVKFRLYELMSKGFVQTNSLKAYTPSVIAMSSVEEDKMVVFSASDVAILASDKTYTVNGPTYDLIGTFQMVEPSTSVLAINEKGDAFIPAKKTINPFRAYVVPHKGTELSSVPIKEYIPVAGITLNRASLSLTVKGSATLSATVLPENATNKGVCWSSHDETIAKVSTTGIVTGIGQGKTTIKVQTEDGDYSASCQVEVLDTNPPTPPTGTVSVVGVVLNPDQYTLKINESVQLTAIIQPADATNKEVSWSSSNESVAKVLQEGKVTASHAGDAIVTVKTTDGNFIATCYIQVVAPTAISAIESGQVNVYPRIVSECFMVTGLTKPARIEIMDYSGQIVKSLKVRNVSECTIYENLPPASYLVRVVQGKDINVFKIIKTKR